MSLPRDELLRLVRDAENPSQADEERVFGKLQASIAAGATNAPAGQPDPGTSAHAKLSQIGVLKMAAIAGGTAACVLLAMLMLHESRATLLHAPERSRSPAPSASAPPPSSPAPPHEDDLIVRNSSVRPDTAPVQQGSTPAAARPPTRTSGVGVRVRSRESSSALRAELELLLRVQAALKRLDGASALRELDMSTQHSDALLAERQAARILALCLLNRVNEARTAAASFAVQHPDSPQRIAIAASCANSTRNEPP